MDHSVLQRLPEPLLCWYRANRRRLPWREHPLPYRVWLSEIMLQQTRVEAVIPYYERFLTALPTIADLAAAPEDTLMKLWEGLGYYSRVRNLQKAARQLVEQWEGQLPCDYDAVRALPGIGDYTAGAICSIAFGLPTPAVDGNVLRVLTRICADGRDVSTVGARRLFAQLLRPLYPPGQCGDFTQALMELGATVCLPNGAPLCAQCPVQGLCLAHAQGQEQKYPTKPPKKPRTIEERTVLLLLYEGRLLVHRRPNKGLLAGLWELPNVAAGQEPPFPLPDAPAEELAPCRHIFSHVEWHLSGRLMRLCSPLSDLPDLPEEWRWVTAHELAHELALPGAFARYRQEALLRMLPGEK